MSDTKPCRCPVRPAGPSLASGSAWETQRLREWQEQHGHHDYAKARDTLAHALQYAERSVRREEQLKAGDAVLDMVADVFGMVRPSEAEEAKQKAQERAAQSRMAVEMLAPQPVEGAYIASEVKAADGANGSSVAPDPPRDMATATDIRPGDEFDLTPTSPDGERMSPVHVSVAQDGNITVTRKE